jgi:hypothetical protein
MLGALRLRGRSVYLRSNQSGAFAALVIAVTLGCSLGGCSNVDLGTDQGWFRKPMDLVGRNSGYTYSDLQESRLNKPISDADLIDANGGCPASAALPPAAPSDAAASPAAPASLPSSGLGEGVGLGMSECEVVARAGQPNAVQIGKAPNGDRTALLTYNSGPRPGIYHFERGRLAQMDRVEVPAPPPQVAKKKPAKPKKQAANNNPT